jgi:hypothetical protein
MTISAKIIADSISPAGNRITSLHIRYPKFIHGEAKTHRLHSTTTAAYEFLNEIGFMDDPNLSRNASSSRAIPVERMIADILRDPAFPIFWGKNRKGMQAIEEMDTYEKRQAIEDHQNDLLHAVASAMRRSARGEHKQTVNRILEPWMHINVLCTATNFSNFFALRIHKDAQPEIRELAVQMWNAMNRSTPKLIHPGEWHLPYVVDEDIDRIQSSRYSFFDQTIPVKDNVTYGLIRLSVARSARLSYLTLDNKIPAIDEDLALYERLVGQTPLHASPAEHQATPDDDARFPHQHGNFNNFRQFRKFLPGESA